MSKRHAKPAPDGRVATIAWVLLHVPAAVVLWALLDGEADGAVREGPAPVSRLEQSAAQAADR